MADNHFSHPGPMQQAPYSQYQPSTPSQIHSQHEPSNFLEWVAHNGQHPTSLGTISQDGGGLPVSSIHALDSGAATSGQRPGLGVTYSTIMNTAVSGYSGPVEYHSYPAEFPRSAGSDWFPSSHDGFPTSHDRTQDHSDFFSRDPFNNSRDPFSNSRLPPIYSAEASSITRTASASVPVSLIEVVQTPPANGWDAATGNSKSAEAQQKQHPHQQLREDDEEYRSAGASASPVALDTAQAPSTSGAAASVMLSTHNTSSGPVDQPADNASPRRGTSSTSGAVVGRSASSSGLLRKASFKLFSSFRDKLKLRKLDLQSSESRGPSTSGHSGKSSSRRLTHDSSRSWLGCLSPSARFDDEEDEPSPPVSNQFVSVRAPSGSQLPVPSDVPHPASSNGSHCSGNTLRTTGSSGSEAQARNLSRRPPSLVAAAGRNIHLSTIYSAASTNSMRPRESFESDWDMVGPEELLGNSMSTSAASPAISNNNNFMAKASAASQLLQGQGQASPAASQSSPASSQVQSVPPLQPPAQAAAGMSPSEPLTSVAEDHNAEAAAAAAAAAAGGPANGPGSGAGSSASKLPLISTKSIPQAGLADKVREIVDHINALTDEQLLSGNSGRLPYTGVVVGQPTTRDDENISSPLQGPAPPFMAPTTQAPALTRYPGSDLMLTNDSREDGEMSIAGARAQAYSQSVSAASEPVGVPCRPRRSSALTVDGSMEQVARARRGSITSLTSGNTLPSASALSSMARSMETYGGAQQPQLQPPITYGYDMHGHGGPSSYSHPGYPSSYDMHGAAAGMGVHPYSGNLQQPYDMHNGGGGHMHVLSPHGSLPQAHEMYYTTAPHHPDYPHSYDMQGAPLYHPPPSPNDVPAYGQYPSPSYDHMDMPHGPHHHGLPPDLTDVPPDVRYRAAPLTAAQSAAAHAAAERLMEPAKTATTAASSRDTTGGQQAARFNITAALSKFQAELHEEQQQAAAAAAVPAAVAVAAPQPPASAAVVREQHHMAPVQQQTLQQQQQQHMAARAASVPVHGGPGHLGFPSPGHLPLRQTTTVPSDEFSLDFSISVEGQRSAAVTASTHSHPSSMNAHGSSSGNPSTVTNAHGSSLEQDVATASYSQPGGRSYPAASAGTTRASAYGHASLRGNPQSSEMLIQALHSHMRSGDSARWLHNNNNGNVEGSALPEGARGNDDGLLDVASLPSMGTQNTIPASASSISSRKLPSSRISMDPGSLVTAEGHASGVSSSAFIGPGASGIWSPSSLDDRSLDGSGQSRTAAGADAEPPPWAIGPANGNGSSDNSAEQQAPAGGPSSSSRGAGAAVVLCDETGKPLPPSMGPGMLQPGSRLLVQPVDVNGIFTPKLHYSAAELFLLVSGGIVILFNVTIIVYVLLTMRFILSSQTLAPGTADHASS